MLIVYRQHVNVFLFLQQTDRISPAWPAHGSGSPVNRNGSSGLQILTSKRRPVPEKLKIGLHDPSTLYLGRCPQRLEKLVQTYLFIYVHICHSRISHCYPNGGCSLYILQQVLQYVRKMEFSLQQRNSGAYNSMSKPEDITPSEISQPSRAGNARCLE